VRDLGILIFLAALTALSLKRPFLLVLAYVYIDILQPQRFSFGLLAGAPVSQLFAALAIGGWLLLDAKRGSRFGGRQALILLLLAYGTYTTFHADFPVEAYGKFEWVWPVLVFSIFLPATLWSRLRVEALLATTILSAATIIIGAGIKTVISGGGYGADILIVNNNTGLYEGSILSTAAIAFIPLLLWFTRHGTIFAPDWRVKAFVFPLIFACLLMPIGTQARTGLIAIAALGLLMLRTTRRPLLYVGMIGALGLISLPLLPQSFQERMGTIQSYQADQSASTRLAIWSWTLDYATRNPFGGGFEAYLQNRFTFRTYDQQGTGPVAIVTAQTVTDQGRAYHSSYFEMLGEQGWPGLALFLLLHGYSLARMEVIRRRFAKAEGEDEWIGPLAGALQNSHLVYLTGCLFVGIAYQPFAFIIVAAQIGLDNMLRLRGRQRAPMVSPQPPLKGEVARAAGA
jgi:probable O-glycosylation ligase (exosortase A-associated)